MPGFESALAAGDVSSSHVDAVANAAKGLDDAGRERLGELQDALLGFARIEPVTVFERRCRLLGKRSPVTKANPSSTNRRRRCRCAAGSTNRPGCTTPTSPWIRNVTPSCGRRSTPSWRRSNKPTATPAPRSIVLFADAVVAAVAGERSGDRRVPEICVHIDYDTMLNGLHELSVCETADGIPLPPETVRRLACEAAIVPIVLNGAGEVLELWPRAPGREPGPAAGVAGDVPHLRLPRLRRRVRPLRHPPRHRMAPPRSTDLDNLLPLVLANITIWCTKDDGDSHSTNTGCITIHRPDGTRHFHGTTINRTRRDCVVGNSARQVATARSTGPP